MADKPPLGRSANGHVNWSMILLVATLLGLLLNVLVALRNDSRLSVAEAALIERALMPQRMASLEAKVAAMSNEIMHLRHQMRVMQALTNQKGPGGR